MIEFLFVVAMLWYGEKKTEFKPVMTSFLTQPSETRIDKLKNHESLSSLSSQKSQKWTRTDRFGVRGAPWTRFSAGPGPGCLDRNGGPGLDQWSRSGTSLNLSHGFAHNQHLPP